MAPRRAQLNGNTGANVWTRDSGIHGALNRLISKANVLVGIQLRRVATAH